MATDGPEASRPLRADARRNRDRLIGVARALFAESGGDVGLEAVARAAGVGIGTLYRHFPTRDALVGEVYRAEVRHLAEAAPRLAGELPPVEALRAWLRLFVDYFAAKKALGPALAAMVGGPAGLYADSGPHLKAAIGLLADRAVAEGAIRLDIDPIDLLRALAGLAGNAPAPGWEEGAYRLVDILIAGLKVAPDLDRGTGSGAS